MNIVKAGRLRVVLDSNVYVSAFTNPQSGLFHIWRAALGRLYTLLVSSSIVNELAGVLRGRFAWEDERVIRRMKLLTRVAEIIIPKIAIDEVPDDADDNRILECAVAGHADLIVSGDRHLADLKSFRGIGIVRPIDFRRILDPKKISPRPRRA